MSQVKRLIYKELAPEQADQVDALSLRAAMSDEPQDHEADIIRYLETAANYSALGKVVGDVLNPGEKAAIYPGTNTDGLYLWPSELGYYVRKYHVHLPNEFVARMASLNWIPPGKASIKWNELHQALAGKTKEQA